jgi:hypothetical protein
MATNRALLDVTANRRWFYGEGWDDANPWWRVLYYNAEESLTEIKRRVIAICQHFRIDPKELTSHAPGETGPLTVMSGHDFPLVFASADGSKITFNEDNVYFLEHQDTDVIMLDPFVSVHQCPENDNNLIDAVVKRFGRIASSRGMSIELVHHARKPAHGGSVEITAADARGASGFGDGVRSLRVLNRMTQNDALRAKVENRRNYFRADGEKGNYAAASSDSQWFRHLSVPLPNGDDVGVVVPWHFPGAFDGVTPAHMQQVRDLARGGEYRADPRSPEWIGQAVAEVLDLDADTEADSKRIKTILKEWYAKGVLKKVERQDDARHVRLWVEPGEWTEFMIGQSLRQLDFRTVAQLSQTVANRGQVRQCDSPAPPMIGGRLLSHLLRPFRVRQSDTCNCRTTVATRCG